MESIRSHPCITRQSEACDLRWSWSDNLGDPALTDRWEIKLALARRHQETTRAADPRDALSPVPRAPRSRELPGGLLAPRRIDPSPCVPHPTSRDHAGTVLVYNTYGAGLTVVAARVTLLVDPSMPPAWSRGNRGRRLRSSSCWLPIQDARGPGISPRGSPVFLAGFNRHTPAARSR